MIVLVTIFYFEYSVSILWDSAHYMNYVNIFEGNLAWNQWDVVRGPVFPIIIYLGNFIFGKTSQGLIMNTYLYYVIMLVFCYRILREFFLEDKKVTIKKRNVIIGLFIFLMIIINPIPGQEEKNAEFLETNCTGIWIKKHDSAYEIFKDLFSNTEKLKNMKNNY